MARTPGEDRRAEASAPTLRPSALASACVSVGVEPKSNSVPQEGQKRLPPATSVAQPGQIMVCGASVPRCSGEKLEGVQESCAGSLVPG